MMFNSHYLVDIENEKIGRVLKPNSLKNGDLWKEMDVLVFHTWEWWYRRGPKQPWDMFKMVPKLSKDMDRMAAFHKGLTTWAKWVDSTVNHSTTKVIFQGISPTHYHGKDQNEPGVTKPISGSVYRGGLPKALYVVKDALSGMRKPVHLLDITTLSQLRKDAHPGFYNGFRRMDCNHWCIAGLPDTWNQLLYAFLLT
nr:protein trichome birefringence-like 38 [Ziziphus jujuba var. spinosa]